MFSLFYVRLAQKSVELKSRHKKSFKKSYLWVSVILEKQGKITMEIIRDSFQHHTITVRCKTVCQLNGAMEGTADNTINSSWTKI